MITSFLRTLHYLGPKRVHQPTIIRLFSNAAITLADMARYHSDPSYRRANLNRCTQYARLRLLRDPAFAARRKAQNASAQQKRRSCERGLRWGKFVEWLRRGWHTANLPWKTYRAEMFLEGVRRACAGCGLSDHKTRFWWTGLDEGQGFLCGKCAAKLGWEDVCPEGFENAATKKEFTARAKELGIEKTHEI